MVRSVADRAFLPAKSLFEQVGNMMILTGKTITATIRPPYPYGGEFVSQFLFALQLCWFPMLISTVGAAQNMDVQGRLSPCGARDDAGLAIVQPDQATHRIGPEHLGESGHQRGIVRG